MGVTLVSQAEYARMRNVDPTSVRDAIRYGRISTIDGKIDPDVADIQWERNTRKRAGSGGRSHPPITNDANLRGDPGGAAPEPPAPGKPAEDYQLSRARREAAEADEAELRVAKMRGTLVERERVESAVFEAFRMLRDRAMAEGSDLAARLTGQTDMSAIEREYHAAIRRAFGDEGHLRQAMNAKGLEP